MLRSVPNNAEVSVGQRLGLKTDRIRTSSHGLVPRIRIQKPLKVSPEGGGRVTRTRFEPTCLLRAIDV